MTRIMEPEVRQHYQEEIEHYTRQIQEHPLEEAPYKNRAMVYEILEENQKALADYNRAIELAPDRLDLYYYRALLYLEMGRYSAGLKDINQAIKMEKDGSYKRFLTTIDLFSLRGDIYVKLEKNKAALNDFSRVIKLAPANSYCKAKIFALERNVGLACTYIKKSVLENLDSHQKAWCSLEEINDDFSGISNTSQFKSLLREIKPYLQS